MQRSGQVQKRRFEIVRSGPFRTDSQMHNEFLTMSVINVLGTEGAEREFEEKRKGGKFTCAAEGELSSVPGSEGGPGLLVWQQ